VLEGRLKLLGQGNIDLELEIEDLKNKESTNKNIIFIIIFA